MRTVSVIIPVYNTEEFLEQCVQSVFNQTYQAFEIILINDHSDDNCQQIINELARTDERIKAFHFTEIKGVGAARNFGIANATGDFVYFLDSDDYLQNDTLQLLIENIHENDMISGRLKKSHLSEDINQEDDDDDNNDEIDGGTGHEIKLYTDTKYNLIKNNSALNRLFRKTYIVENKLKFSEEVERYSDLAFMVPALLHTDSIPLISNCLYYKRQRNDPISNPSLMQEGMEARIIDFTFVYNHLKDNYQDENI